MVVTVMTALIVVAVAAAAVAVAVLRVCASVDGPYRVRVHVYRRLYPYRHVVRSQQCQYC